MAHGPHAAPDACSPACPHAGALPESELLRVWVALDAGRAGLLASGALGLTRTPPGEPPRPGNTDSPPFAIAHTAVSAVNTRPSLTPAHFLHGHLTGKFGSFMRMGEKKADTPSGQERLKAQRKHQGDLVRSELDSLFERETARSLCGVEKASAEEMRELSALLNARGARPCPPIAWVSVALRLLHTHPPAPLPVSAPQRTPTHP